MPYSPQHGITPPPKKITFFVYAGLPKGHGNSQKKFKRPEEIYFRKKELEEYFDGCPEVWFLDESEGISVWADLGIENWPRRISKVPALSWKEKTEIRDGDGCTREIAVMDYDLHGLVHYLESLKNRDTSVLKNSAMILWNFLLAYHEGISSHQYEEFFRGKYEWFYFHKKSAHFKSSFLKSLRSNKWLPSKNGGVHSPGSLRLADLPDGFKKDEALSKILKMKSTEFEALASKLEFDPAFLELVRENEDKVKEFLKKQHEQVQNDVDINTQLDDEGYESDINYDKEFENAFNHKSRGIELSQREPARGIVDPDRRREKVGGQIKNEQRAEPSIVSRFKRVSRKVWERKDNRVRNFLTEEYNGKCQICDETFLKINGAPYFEGLYLVPRIHARWLARPGNVLCLCPTCCAKFQYGPVVADDILTQIMSIRTAAEGAIEKPYLTIELCGRREQIRFTESHLLELQGLLRASQGER